MRISEIMPGEVYEGAYGEPMTVIEYLGAYEQRRSAYYTKSFKQAVRVTRSSGREDIVEARSLKGLYTPKEQAQISARAAHAQSEKQFAELLAILEPLGARGQFNLRVSASKPAQLTLSGQAVAAILEALQARPAGALLDVLSGI
jgi:hypothetical protein